MALLFVDGFDHYANADVLKKWTAAIGSGTLISTSAGRRGGGAATISNAGSQVLRKTLQGNYQTLIVGAAVSLSIVSPAIACEIFSLMDSTTVQMSLRIDAAGKLAVYRGGTLLATATNPLSASVFYYIEFKVKIDPSVGTYEVKLNGASVAGLPAASSQNTRSSSNSYTNGLLLGTASGSGLVQTFDDLYIADNSGSTNNDFLGDCRVDTLLPNGDGNYTSFTPSTGTSHYQLVDESTPNTTDYNESSTATNKDSYQMVNLGALTSQTIYGVQVSGAVLKDDAGVRSIKVGARSSSTDSVSAAQALSTSQLYYSNIHETDPATSTAWTESGVNAAEALFEVA